MCSTLGITKEDKDGVLLQENAFCHKHTMRCFNSNQKGNETLVILLLFMSILVLNEQCFSSEQDNTSKFRQFQEQGYVNL